MLVWLEERISKMFVSNSSLVGLILTLLSCCGFGEVIDDSTGIVNSPVDEVGEYCQMETMKGRCRWKSEVIVMTSARWGRMKTGRCLNIHPNFLATFSQDPMFLGCSEDVISIVDKKCSGRSECDIRIPDADLEKVTPCYPDQKSYLETSYTCVKVVQESRSCLVSVANEEQYISSTSSFNDANSMSNCGSRSHPWRLEAPVGQRITISILDFSAIPRDHDVTCHHYGYIVEKSSKKNVSICASNAAGEGATSVGGASPQREHSVYQSGTNRVEIVLIREMDANNYNFLIKLQAVGCTNMIPPDNAWLKRSNNDIVIGCYLSQQTWQLKCDGHEWKGQVGTCPDTYVKRETDSNATRVVTAKSDPKMLMVMVVIAGGALIVCVTIVAIGIMCLRRCKRSYKKTPIQSARDVTQYVTTAQSTFQA